MNNESLFENSQLTISYELLHFLRWIVATEPEMLQALMHQAYESGFMDHESLQQEAHHAHLPSNDDLQRNVIDFFDLLELKLQEASLDHEQLSVQNELRPAVNHIDSSICDDEVVALSVAQASSQLHHNNPQNVQETLYKELLKNWRPRNKHCFH